VEDSDLCATSSSVNTLWPVTLASLGRTFLAIAPNDWSGLGGGSLIGQPRKIERRNVRCAKLACSVQIYVCESDLCLLSITAGIDQRSIRDSILLELDDTAIFQGHLVRGGRWREQPSEGDGYDGCQKCSHNQMILIVRGHINSEV
jgi:hypothetical protein